jgi:putative SOS response-associated peptidase YedK
VLSPDPGHDTGHMCGRYTLTTPPSVVAEHFQVPELPNFPPRYNIAPTQQALVVRAGQGRRELVLLRWGLIPSWAKDPAIGARMINARAEGIAEKPSFRRAWKEKRCLVPADGFYEWQKDGKRKQPYYIRRRDGAPFAFAGLWERWQGGEEILDTFTIITTAPNEVIAPIHNRMPVIVPEAAYDRWLDPDERGDPELLVPYPDEELTAYPVSTVVNSPIHDDARCVEPSG